MFESELEAFDKLSSEEKAEIIALMKEIIAAREAASSKKDDADQDGKH